MFPKNQKAKPVPFFEDSQSQKIAGYSTRQSVGRLKAEIIDEIELLGGEAVRFTAHEYTGGRDGFRISFLVGPAAARFDVVALPFRLKKTEAKAQQAIKQMLYLVAASLRAQRMEYAYRPGSAPLLPYLVASNGKTMNEIMIERLPQMLQAGR